MISPGTKAVLLHSYLFHDDTGSNWFTVEAGSTVEVQEVIQPFAEFTETMYRVSLDLILSKPTARITDGWVNINLVLCAGEMTILD